MCAGFIARCSGGRRETWEADLSHKSKVQVLRLMNFPQFQMAQCTKVPTDASPLRVEFHEMKAKLFVQDGKCELVPDVDLQCVDSGW